MNTRRRRACSIALRVAVFLLLGAVVNVAVAWGCATSWSTMSPPALVDTDRSDLPAFVDSSMGRSQQVTETFKETTALYIERGFGVDRDCWMLGELYPNAARQPTFTRRVNVYWAGYPCAALRCELYLGIIDIDKLVNGRWIALAGRDFLIPLRPIWPGFAINTVFYAAILGLLFAAPGSVRRWRRIRRGLCAKCAYPIGTSEVCTECGAAVRPDGAAECSHGSAASAPRAATTCAAARHHAHTNQAATIPSAPNAARDNPEDFCFAHITARSSGLLRRLRELMCGA